MKRDISVSSPPQKPLLIYDGDCNFCTLWIKRWQQGTGDRIDYLPSQDPLVRASFPEIPAKAFEESVQLIETDGQVYSDAEAVFRSLEYSPCKEWPLWSYRNIPGIAPLTERSYQFISKHRRFFSFLTRLGWGREIAPPTYAVSSWLFLRLLGILYLIAFVSLWTQLLGLIGSHGILPASETMHSVREQLAQGNFSSGGFFAFPTLCWFSSSDAFLNLQCGAGALLALMLTFGLAPRVCLFFLWLLYLSLSTISREFLSFQWDILLLEVGFLAIFFAPRDILPKVPSRPSRLFRGLLIWLLFRLMFESGCVKLLSGDATWRNLTALRFHYETQPLPTWIGWYAHQLPDWLQKLSVLGMFGVELVIPFFFFAPRRLRLFASVATVLLETFILCTGNYGFFNWLTITLCLLLLDDITLRRWVPERWREKVAGAPLRTPNLECEHPRPVQRRLRFGSSVLLAAFILLVSFSQMTTMFRRHASGPHWLVAVQEWVSPFRSINPYGLFAVMTTSRPEIIIEGSNDGQTWLAYEFKYKPGDLKRPPSFVAPHQPRLDWQVWFAALGSYQENPWFIYFCERLMEGSPDVIALLERNPFPNNPPKQIRAVVYDYHFTDLATRRRTGEWWRRERKELYCPVLRVK